VFKWVRGGGGVKREVSSKMPLHLALERGKGVGGQKKPLRLVFKRWRDGGLQLKVSEIKWQKNNGHTSYTMPLTSLYLVYRGWWGSWVVEVRHKSDVMVTVQPPRPWPRPVKLSEGTICRIHEITMKSSRIAITRCLSLLGIYQMCIYLSTGQCGQSVVPSTPWSLPQTSCFHEGKWLLPSFILHWQKCSQKCLEMTDTCPFMMVAWIHPAFHKRCQICRWETFIPMGRGGDYYR
jgi:hypothetical protein